LRQGISPTKLILGFHGVADTYSREFCAVKKAANNRKDGGGGLTDPRNREKLVRIVSEAAASENNLTVVSDKETLGLNVVKKDGIGDRQGGSNLIGTLEKSPV
jgi:hypothetical protein